MCGPRPECEESGCGRGADFFRYDAGSECWRPVCRHHLPHVHPSIETKAWMESGYLKPAELGEPEGPPGEPPTERAAAFRAEVDETMGWTE